MNHSTYSIIIIVASLCVRVCGHQTRPTRERERATVLFDNIVRLEKLMNSFENSSKLGIFNGFTFHLFDGARNSNSNIWLVHCFFFHFKLFSLCILVGQFFNQQLPHWVSVKSSFVCLTGIESNESIRCHNRLILYWMTSVQLFNNSTVLLKTKLNTTCTVSETVEKIKLCKWLQCHWFDWTV